MSPRSTCNSPEGAAYRPSFGPRREERVAGLADPRRPKILDARPSSVFGRAESGRGTWADHLAEPDQYAGSAVPQTPRPARLSPNRSRSPVARKHPINAADRVVDAALTIGQRVVVGTSLKVRPVCACPLEEALPACPQLTRADNLNRSGHCGLPWTGLSSMMAQVSAEVRHIGRRHRSVGQR